jgi:hypothetical protein
MVDPAVVLERQAVHHDGDGEVTAPVRLFVGLFALKLLALAIDPTIRVYLGDSAAYLYGATDSGRLPDDRSFTYSLLIRALATPFESLWALVWWQTAAGVAVGALAWHLLVHRLAVSRRLASIAVAVLVIEPAQLYYERMVLAETFGLLAFMLFCAGASAYVDSGRIGWLPLTIVLGLTAVSLRLNYLPVVLVISAGLPLIRLFSHPRPAWREVVTHVAIAALCVATTHLAFHQWVAYIFKSPPGYIARAGFMQLGLVMPLVTPEHLQQVGLPRDLEQQLRFPLDDPDLRMSHQWAPGGLVRTLRDRGIAIEPVARPLVRMALRDDPLGLVRMGVHTVGNYFRDETIGHALENDLGRRVIPYDVLWTLREIWNYDADGLWSRETPISRYFERATPVLVVCLLALGPLALACVILERRTAIRAQIIFFALLSIGLVMAHVLFVPVAFYRYLHPLPVFVVLNVTALASVSMRRRT